MKQIRQMIQKGDPMVRIQLPAITLRLLEGSATKNKRRVQDQFIKALAETFKNEQAFDVALEKLLPDLKQIYQQ